MFKITWSNLWGKGFATRWCKVNPHRWPFYNEKRKYLPSQARRYARILRQFSPLTSGQTLILHCLNNRMIKFYEDIRRLDSLWNAKVSFFTPFNPAEAAAHTLWPGLSSLVGTLVLKHSLGHLCIFFKQLPRAAPSWQFPGNHLTLSHPPTHPSWICD